MKKIEISVFETRQFALTFPGSSMAEQLTVNQLVAGSSPAPGAKIRRGLIKPFFDTKKPLSDLEFLDYLP